ncbi:MAG: rhodanese-like domain-containing protein [Phycisphaeraceae bacterium]
MTTTSQPPIAAYGSISPEQLSMHLQSDPNALLIDVRTPAEYHAVHIPQARLMPLDQFDTDTIRTLATDNQSIYVICHTGGRGAKACERLVSAGLRNVINIEGGTAAWADAGLPVTRAKGAISMMRQVQITAGSLILLGMILAATVHPWFIGLSGFVGAGLLFAGLTDTCGMAMLLARMPWNKKKPSSQNCSI